jgi:XTP/dITP diphosphohydrolase
MLVFATNNIHKLEEARQIISLPVKSLRDLKPSRLWENIPETAETLQGNALQKAMFVYDRLKTDGNDVSDCISSIGGGGGVGSGANDYDIFADDTGLEVRALGGEPSVFSARYANFPNVRITSLSPTKIKRYATFPEPPFHLNIEKLLSALKKFKTAQERAACFRTVICLLRKGTIHYFEGRVDGYILFSPQGEAGFGYDSVFCPDDYKTAGIDGTPKSFAELSPCEKNAISHRGKALRKMQMFYETSINAAFAQANEQLMRVIDPFN